MGKVLISRGTKTKNLISRCRSVSLMGELEKNKLCTDKGGEGHMQAMEERRLLL